MNLWQKSAYFIQSAFSTTVQYHGLLNQGATCYLNSVLQVLFMTKEFRDAVGRHTSENPDTEHIDRDLKTLFDELNEQTTNAYNITNRLGIDRVYEQRDAAEYFEKILSLTSRDASQIFRGELTQKTTCSGCGTETDNDGGFWHLPLALVDSYSKHYSVVDGIEEYFRASDLCGENQMYCDQCDDKSDATIKCVIKHHPEVLMLLLKRFEFDYCYMMYVKINRTVDVPYTLQIPENQTYELYAFVEHFGDLRSGHYTATIKDDEKWYNFNDHKVTLLGFQPFPMDNSERSKSVYLLFYRKTKVRAADTCTPVVREVSPPGGLLPPDEENMEVNEEAEDQPEKRETQFGETQPEESVEVQDNDRGRQRTPDISHDFKLQVGERCNLSKQDEMSNAQSRVIHVKTDRDGETADDEQSERKQRTLIKYPDRAAEIQDDEDNVRQNINNNLGDTQEVDLKPVSVEQQGDRARMKNEMKVDKEGKNGVDERGKASKRRKLSTKSDSLSRDIHHSGIIADSEQNMSKDDQRCKQGGSRRYNSHEEQRGEKRDVQGVNDQKRGDRHVSVERQNKEQERKRNEHVQNRADSSSLKRVQSAGSKRLTENQAGCSTEKMIPKDCQPKARPESKEGQVEGRHASNKSRTYHEKDNLSDSFHKLGLSESCSLESKRCGTKRGIENVEEEDETNSTIDSNTRKKPKVPDTQTQAAGMEEKVACEKKRKWWHLSASWKRDRKEKSQTEQKKGEKQAEQKKEKNKQNQQKKKSKQNKKRRKNKEEKTIGCFSFF